MPALFVASIPAPIRPYCFFFHVTRRLPRSTLFPYTTLFRSLKDGCRPHCRTPPVERTPPGKSEPGLVPEEDQEEHTSELQSHHDLVCRLLLEKKKQSLPRHRAPVPSPAYRPLRSSPQFCRIP